MTSKRLGLRSEASARFERGVDPNGVLRASDRVVELLTEVAGAPVGPPRDRRVPGAGRAGAHPGAPGARRRGARARARRRPRCATRCVRSASTSRTTATTTRSSRSRPRSGPTSSARSTSSRRSAAASASTRSRARCRTPPSRAAGSRPAQRARRRIADVLVGIGLREAITIPLIAEADLTRFGRAGRRHRAGHQRAERRGAGAAAGDPARPAQVGRPQRRATGSPTSACSSSGTSSPRRRPGSCCPTSATTSPSCSPGSCARAPVEPDRPVDVYDAIDALRRARRRPPPRRRRDPVRATDPGYRPGRSAAVVGRRRRRSARWASSTRRCSRAFGIGGAGGRVRARDRRRCSPATRRDQDFVPLSTLSRGDDGPRVRARRVDAGGGGARDAARRGRRPGGGRPGVRRVPRRRARRGQAEPRVRDPVPRARPHADRQGAGQGAEGLHRRRRRARTARCCAG